MYISWFIYFFKLIQALAELELLSDASVWHAGSILLVQIQSRDDGRA